MNPVEGIFPRWDQVNHQHQLLKAAQRTHSRGMAPETVFSLPSSCATESCTDSPASCAHNVDDESTRSVVETVVRVTTEESAMNGSHDEESKSARSSSDSFVVAYHAPLRDGPMNTGSPSTEAGSCGGACWGIPDGGDYVCTEFQKNWPDYILDGHPASVRRVEPGLAAASNSQKPVVKRRAISRDSSHPGGRQAPKELVVNSTSEELPEKERKDCSSSSRRRRHSRRGGSREWRFPVWWDSNSLGQMGLTNSSNEAPAIAGATSTQPLQQQQPQLRTMQMPQGQLQQPPPQMVNKEQGCCPQCSVLRVLCLILYYVLLWAVTGAITWGLLEAVLQVTSRGPYPFYMAPHSYCLRGLQVGYAGVKSKPGEVSKFNDLTALLATLTTELTAINKSVGESKHRICRPDDDITDPDVLSLPCDVKPLINKAIPLVSELLKKNPVAMLKIRRRLGFIPKTSMGVIINCTANIKDKSLPLVYWSWLFDMGWINNSEFGVIHATYFPLLTKLHNAAPVLVAINADDNQDWRDKEVTFKCRAYDGEYDSKPTERLMILKVQSIGRS